MHEKDGGGRAREENQERQNDVCLWGEIGAGDRSSLEDRGGRGRRTRKGTGTERTRRGTQRGGGAPRWHTQTSTHEHQGPRISLHWACSRPVPSTGPQASGGEGQLWFFSPYATGSSMGLMIGSNSMPSEKKCMNGHSNALFKWSLLNKALGHRSVGIEIAESEGQTHVPVWGFVLSNAALRRSGRYILADRSVGSP